MLPPHEIIQAQPFSAQFCSQNHFMSMHAHSAQPFWLWINQFHPDIWTNMLHFLCNGTKEQCFCFQTLIHSSVLPSWNSHLFSVILLTFWLCAISLQSFAVWGGEGCSWMQCDSCRCSDCGHIVVLWTLQAVLSVCSAQGQILLFQWDCCCCSCAGEHVSFCSKGCQHDAGDHQMAFLPSLIACQHWTGMFVLNIALLLWCPHQNWKFCNFKKSAAGIQRLLCCALKKTLWCCFCLIVKNCLTTNIASLTNLSAAIFFDDWCIDVAVSAMCVKGCHPQQPLAPIKSSAHHKVHQCLPWSLHGSFDENCVVAMTPFAAFCVKMPTFFGTRWNFGTLKPSSKSCIIKRFCFAFCTRQHAVWKQWMPNTMKQRCGKIWVKSSLIWPQNNLCCHQSRHNSIHHPLISFKEQLALDICCSSCFCNELSILHHNFAAGLGFLAFVFIKQSQLGDQSQLMKFEDCQHKGISMGYPLLLSAVNAMAKSDNSTLTLLQKCCAWFATDTKKQRQCASANCKFRSAFWWIKSCSYA